MVDRGAGAVGVERDHLAGDVAGDVERVAAVAAVEHGDHVGRGAEDVEVVVAAEAVDLDLLDVGVADEQAGALTPSLVMTKLSLASVPMHDDAC